MKKTSQVETVKISYELNIDLASDGAICGIESLNANEQLEKEDEGRLLVLNEATGKRAEVEML
jgi:uncharacterized protein YuzE